MGDIPTYIASFEVGDHRVINCEGAGVSVVRWELGNINPNPEFFHPVVRLEQRESLDRSSRVPELSRGLFVCSQPVRTVPFKMVAPRIPPRMKEMNDFAGYQVSFSDVGALRWLPCMHSSARLSMPDSPPCWRATMRST